MTHRGPGVVVAVLVSGVMTAACSSSAPAAGPPGALAGGQAEIVIDDQTAATTDAVSCQTMGWFTIVDIGDEASGATVYVSNGDALAADWVDIRNVGGFTGSFNPDHDGQAGEATIGMTGATYQIDGTARGVFTAQPGTSTTGDFAIKASC